MGIKIESSLAPDFRMIDQASKNLQYHEYFVLSNALTMLFDLQAHSATCANFATTVEQPLTAGTSSVTPVMPVMNDGPSTVEQADLQAAGWMAYIDQMIQYYQYEKKWDPSDLPGKINDIKKAIQWALDKCHALKGSGAGKVDKAFSALIDKIDTLSMDQTSSWDTYQSKFWNASTTGAIKIIDDAFSSWKDAKDQIKTLDSDTLFAAIMLFKDLDQNEVTLSSMAKIDQAFFGFDPQDQDPAWSNYSIFTAYYLTKISDSSVRNISFQAICCDNFDGNKHPFLFNFLAGDGTAPGLYHIYEDIQCAGGKWPTYIDDHGVEHYKYGSPDMVIQEALDSWTSWLYYHS